MQDCKGGVTRQANHGDQSGEEGDAGDGARV